MPEPRVTLPNTPERRKPLVECSECERPSDPHTGVCMPGGKFKCALCYRRRMFTSIQRAGRKQR